ncbi:MAG: DUF3365 domain-containing protein [Candidatus Marinimicrobia bacterium]|nr:DUF3365 domain-containing protein [FCB group bacterium]MBL7024944.1 DUF3365 domain-containing protein [Candidatus Neomarinimicrobiota bacterium]
MNLPKYLQPSSSRLKRTALLMAIFWTLIILLELNWSLLNLKEAELRNAHTQAATAFEKDVQYRRWNANAGGVYVRVNESIRPNPYLDMEHRDLLLANGDTLTLMNPAYMTRLAHEIALEETGVRGHITSLNPIRPENEADDWEKSALSCFNDSTSEVTAVENLDGVKYFRMMRPLYVEKSCLECHEKQGYKLGDIRGGISVAVPMKTALDDGYLNPVNEIISRCLFWLLGLAGIVYSFVRLEHFDKQRRKAEKELLDSNKMKELLIDTITHDLTNPIGIIYSMSDLLASENAGDQKLGLIKSSSERLLAVMQNTVTLSQLALGDAIPKSEFDITADIKSMANEFQDRLVEAVLTLKIDLPEKLMIQANPILSEVFRNYISNAIKYAAEGDQIIIDHESEAGVITINVKDFGSTIPENLRENVFARKYQMGTEKPGRGLGLAIVKRIVEAHGAQVGVKPNEPRGNIFFIKIS